MCADVVTTLLARWRSTGRFSGTPRGRERTFFAVPMTDDASLYASRKFPRAGRRTPRWPALYYSVLSLLQPLDRCHIMTNLNHDEHRGTSVHSSRQSSVTMGTRSGTRSAGGTGRPSTIYLQQYHTASPFLCRMRSIVGIYTCGMYVV